MIETCTVSKCLIVLFSWEHVTVKKSTSEEMGVVSLRCKVSVGWTHTSRAALH